jgi:hypothetical protein
MAQIYQWIYRFEGLPVSSAVTVWSSTGAAMAIGTTDEFGVLEVELDTGRYFATAAAGGRALAPVAEYEPGNATPVTVDGTAETFHGDVYFGSGRPWYDPMAFGCKFNGVADDRLAWTSLINAINAAGVPACIHIPHGSSKVTSGALPAFAVSTLIIGSGSGQMAAPSGSLLTFARGCGGLSFATTATASAVEHLGLYGSAASGAVGTDNGITALTTVQLNDIRIRGFSQDGVNIDTSTGGNANHSSLFNVSTYACRRDGRHFLGSNSNVISDSGSPVSSANGRWGYYNGLTTITNTSLGAHADSNGTRRVFTDMATTLGSATILSATADWAVNDWVSGSGIPIGAYVDSVVAGVSAHFYVDGFSFNGSAEATATATASDVTATVVTGGAFYDNGQDNAYYSAYVEANDYALMKIDTASDSGIWQGGRHQSPIWIQPATHNSRWSIYVGGVFKSTIAYDRGKYTTTVLSTVLLDYTLATSTHNTQVNDSFITFYIPITALPATASIQVSVTAGATPTLRTIIAGSDALATAAWVATVPIMVPAGSYFRAQLGGTGGAAGAVKYLLEAQ